MALTDFCSIFASVHEDAINTVVKAVATQRPSLFNYGTPFFVQNPGAMCEKIAVHPKLPPSQPRVGPQPLLPVPGTNGLFGLEFCMQVTKLAIDFHEGDFELPRELGTTLQPQRFALTGRVCAAIACPPRGWLAEAGDAVAGTVRPIDPFAALRGKEHDNLAVFKPPSDVPKQTIPVPVDRRRIHCFCLDVFAVGGIRIVDNGFGPRLALELEGVEIVDIKPIGLEDSIECLVSATLQLGLLPRLRIALDALTFSLGDYATLAVSPTPVSGNVPFNPDISKDRLSVFIDVAIS
jgi:hypothetical protein